MKRYIIIIFLGLLTSTTSAGIITEVEHDSLSVTSHSDDAIYNHHQFSSVKNVFKLNVGPSLFISRIRTPDQNYCSKVGLNLSAEYERVTPLGLGIGLKYSHCSTSLGNDHHLNLTYLGLNILWAIRFEQGGGDLGIGWGYAHFNDGFNSGNGGGTKLRFGFEYRLFKHLVLGAELELSGYYFDTPENIHLSKKEGFFYKEIILLVGPRFYF